MQIQLVNQELHHFSQHIESVVSTSSWLLFAMFNCDFVTFPGGMLGQVWYWIASIHDLCCPSYFPIMKLDMIRKTYSDMAF